MVRAVGFGYGVTFPTYSRRLVDFV